MPGLCHLQSRKIDLARGTRRSLKLPRSVPEVGPFYSWSRTVPRAILRPCPLVSDRYSPPPRRGWLLYVLANLHRPLIIVRRLITRLLLPFSFHRPFSLHLEPSLLIDPSLSLSRNPRFPRGSLAFRVSPLFHRAGGNRRAGTKCTRLALHHPANTLVSDSDYKADATKSSTR